MKAFQITRRGLLASSLAVGAMLAGSAAFAQDKITLALALPFQGNGWQAGVVASATWAVEEANKSGKTVELVIVDAAGEPTVLIIGTGLIGASIGLALRASGLTVWLADTETMKALSEPTLQSELEESKVRVAPARVMPRPQSLRRESRRFATLLSAY